MARSNDDLKDMDLGQLLADWIDPTILAIEDALNEGVWSRGPVQLVIADARGLPRESYRNVIEGYRWLVDQGFDLPTVLVLSGSRGAAAKAIRLDYHVDDNSQNCFDVIADSTAKPILLIPASQQPAIASARKLGIGVVHRIGDAIDVLEQATLAQTNPSLLQRIASMVGVFAMHVRRRGLTPLIAPDGTP